MDAGQMNTGTNMTGFEFYDDWLPQEEPKPKVSASQMLAFLEEYKLHMKEVLRILEKPTHPSYSEGKEL